MLRGIVKWFNEQKGLGMIVPANDMTSPGVVVLSRTIPFGTLNASDEVGYEIEPNLPGLVRRVVKVANP